MNDTATTVLSRMLFGEPTPTQLTAKINQVCGGSFAEIDITLHVTASVFSPERSSEELQDDIRRAVDEKYGVKGTPCLFIETDHQREEKTNILLKDLLQEDRVCQSNGCNNRLQQGDVIYCSNCSEEMNS